MVQSVKNPSSEWLEVRDGNGRLLFLYSPLRDLIRIKQRNLTTDVDLRTQRDAFVSALLAQLSSVPSPVPLDVLASLHIE